MKGIRHGNGAGPGQVLSPQSMSPYPYLIPDGLKFIISSPYLLGIGYPQPVPYPIQIRKIIFFVKKILKI